MKLECREGFFESLKLGVFQNSGIGVEITFVTARFGNG